MPRYFFHPLNYWDISQQCTPNINWHQSYYNHGIASPYRLLGKVCCAAKSLRSLRILRCAMGWKKRCRVLRSDTALFCFLQLHYIFFRRRKCVCTVCRCCYYLPERCSTDISCHKKTLCSGDPVLASFHISAFVKLANAL